MTAGSLYESRAERFSTEADELGRRSSLISNLRGLSFGVAFVSLLFFLFGQHPKLAGALLVIAGLLFGLLLVWHSRVTKRQELALRWWRVNDDARARVTARWHELAENGARFVSSAHPYTSDLDIFGPSSLFQRLNVAHTRLGQEALASYLSEPAAVDIACQRQAAARLLAPELLLRQELEALALSLVLPRAWTRGDHKVVPAPDPEPLLRWAELRPAAVPSAAFIWSARVLPILTVSGLLGAGLLNLPALVWAIPLAVQVVLSSLWRGRVIAAFSSVSQGQGVFSQYGPMLQLLESLKLESPALSSLRERILVNGEKPSSAMRRFGSLVGWFELRNNPLIHPLVNAVLLWDVHCLLALENWQRRFGSSVRGWFQCLGELEALSSLAGFAHDNPSFVWPTFADDQVMFTARGLGHPLIDASIRVGNDVELAGASQALLITGSNMSGKSTLLRSIGISQVMALAGAPVCATELRACGAVVRTSLRISDSLEQGVSHFYAELRKLKLVIDTVRSSASVLFLLDEILHGTNSVERQIGARWILGELLRAGAIGAISTHDTGLCTLPPDLMSSTRQFHFRETVQGDSMTFDYKLRSGPVQGGNALRLMRALGLEVPLAGC